MLLGQTGLTPQIIHSIPRVLHHSAVTRHFELLLFLPRPENVQDVSHRSIRGTLMARAAPVSCPWHVGEERAEKTEAWKSLGLGEKVSRVRTSRGGRARL